MKTVRQLLENKGYEVATIVPEKSVYEAMQIMASRNIGALLVLVADKLVGIYTERDFARKAYLLDRPARDIKLNEIMTRQVVYVSPDRTSDECMALMTEKRVRHLPVLENGRVIGLISIGDLVKEAIADQEFIIHQLENYIHG